MEIPNYDFNEDENTNFKQLYKYMPKSNFRMLISSPSGGGKTNLLYQEPLWLLNVIEDVCCFLGVHIFSAIRCKMFHSKI